MVRYPLVKKDCCVNKFLWGGFCGQEGFGRRASRCAFRFLSLEPLHKLRRQFRAIRNWHQQDTLKLPPFFVGEVKLDVEAACKLLADHQRGVTQSLDSFWC